MVLSIAILVLWASFCYVGVHLSCEVMGTGLLIASEEGCRTEFSYKSIASGLPVHTVRFTTNDEKFCSARSLILSLNLAA